MYLVEWCSQWSNCTSGEETRLNIAHPGAILVSSERYSLPHFPYGEPDEKVTARVVPALPRFSGKKGGKGGENWWQCSSSCPSPVWRPPIWRASNLSPRVPTFRSIDSRLRRFQLRDLNKPCINTASSVSLQWWFHKGWRINLQFLAENYFLDVFRQHSAKGRDGEKEGFTRETNARKSSSFSPEELSRLQKINILSSWTTLR